VHSSDRRITVTVTGSGALTDLTIHPRTFDELDHDQIAALVLATVQKATRQAGEELREGLSDVLRDDEFVDELMSKWPGMGGAEGEDRDEQAEMERLLGH
jgi:DNA-binding protein YbaB